jgi:drug/metabolite transporter (DMT)-like permease
MASARLARAVWFASLVTAWGFNYLFVRIGLADSPPLWLAAIRSLLGTAGVAAGLALGIARTSLSRAEIRDALLIGLPNTGLFFGLWFLAATRVPPGQTAVLIYTFPLWVALLSIPLLELRLSALQALTIAGGFGGVVLISQPWSGSSAGLSPVAVAELLGSAVCWAVGTVFYKKRFRGESMHAANFYQLASGSAMLVAWSLVAEPSPAIRWTLPLMVAIVWLGLIGTAYAYAVWFLLLDRYAAASLSAWMFLVPIVALVASVAVTGERLVPIQIVGVALVLASTYGIVREPAASGPKPREGIVAASRAEARSQDR